MEHYLEIAGAKLTRALEQLRASSAGEHYRALLAALQEIVARLASSRLEPTILVLYRYCRSEIEIFLIKTRIFKKS